MPLKARFLSFASNIVTRRLATKGSRFKLAVTTGFVLVAIGFLTVTVDDRPGFAQGFLESLFNGGQPFGQSSQAAPTAQIPQYRHARSARSHAIDRVRTVASRDDYDDPLSSHEARVGGRSVCVRLCDGFAFPVGAYHGAGDRMAHEATCQSECPGAATALYVLPSGSDAITDAVDARTGQNYSELPDAFHYTTLIQDSCSCHPAAGSHIKSLLRDFTLRRGDAVMTGHGIKVFHGAPHFPFRQRDFVALHNSSDIKRNARPTYEAIERESLKHPAGSPQEDQVAVRAPAKVDTKLLDHEASR